MELTTKTGGSLPTNLRALLPWLQLIGKSSFFGLIISLAWTLSAQAMELRVAINKGVSNVRVGSSTPALVKNGGGATIGRLDSLVPANATASGRNINLAGMQASQITIEPSGDGRIWIGDRWYRGKVRLIRQGNGVSAVNLVDIEEYLYSVVGSEAIPSWPLEALKAQAVAARTYAIYQTSKDSNRYYDLDTTTATQVYKGVNNEYVSTVEAVEATQGQVMTYNGKVILAAFHAASGGHTENVEDVWMSPLPYLRGVVDYDQGSPVFSWNQTFSNRDLSRHIGGIGTITGLTPLKVTPRGRIASIQVNGTGGRKTLTGNAIRQALKLRSTLFTVSKNGDNFTITGRGSGHGIGLSQWGAYGLAQKGTPYQQILSHYYQSASLTQLNR
ncbi:SpoIID/LytB domain-containing protein [Synechocystis salina]|uniref:SpoIID/LytB domain-containing protein n=1 Tax=Synechocystis salina LEGE 00031 TaxID=1828736 RepID=A0ABR9VQN7_9SYNC|nr:SpoIID/LytB domain-containing protein [Synechocystis salina]MBE9241177.1 SpoIID/LytB domain-containing protein [Synechocystis salina LEGE 00041]MBE9252803.1 SpoIID/LytB domain-containing protein [Synechocystis salina LEGE 00031]